MLTAKAQRLSKPKALKLGGQINTGKTTTNLQKHRSEAITPNSQRATLLFSAPSRMTNHIPVLSTYLQPSRIRPPHRSSVGKLDDAALFRSTTNPVIPKSGKF
jgi:hypothetical protein